ncbi:MAG TPA: carboxymuconolactone decarboxylase family protein [Ardenticatenaceae bacterium]|nr:carboxymuconolactone decarboxylase family protein [Ardenticatenaceae bacterium]
MTQFDTGMANRRAVLGDRHVNKAMQGVDPLAQPLQELVTEYCWGAVWDRPGLPRPTRSLLTIAMLTTAGHHDELRVHVGGALRNGCTPDEISEVIIQSAIYAGVPAALSAMRVVVAAIADSQEQAAHVNGATPEKEGRR